MEKLYQIGILHRGSSDFLSYIMSQTRANLKKATEYHLVVDCNEQVVPHYYIYQIISVVSQVLD